MSCYMRMTKHPKTGEWENAFWMDDWFGHHNYGVLFPSEVDGAKNWNDLDTRAARGKAHNPHDVDLETRDHTIEELDRDYPLPADMEVAREVKVEVPRRAYVNVTVIKGETFRIDWDSGKTIELTHNEWMALRRAQNSLIFTEPT